MSKERIVVDGKGTERAVRPLSRTIIERPNYSSGLTTFADYIDGMREAQEFRKKESLWKEEVDIDIQTPYKWFGVRGFCDTHIGHSGVDYDRLEEMLAGFLLHDNLRAMGLGDLGDFFVPKGRYPDGMLSAVAPPQTQLSALKKFFTEYQDQFLSITNDPSHPDWIYQTAGLDPYRLMAEDLGIPFVNQGGITRLNVNGITYEILAFHKIAKFKSSFNLTHAHKRALELHRDADAVMAGHIHKGEIGKAVRNGERKSLLQYGTLKLNDKHGTKQGYLGRPEPYYPILLLRTDKKSMQVIDNLEDAEDMLDVKL